MDLKAALQYLTRELPAKPQLITVSETWEEETRVLIDGCGKATEYHVPIEAPPRMHNFSTLQGFLDYLNSLHCQSGNHVVFVGSTLVDARLGYLVQPINDRVALRLEYSEEYAALTSLFQQNKAKTVWKLLANALAGAFQPALMAMISQLDIKGSATEKVTVDATGIVANSKDSHFTVSYTDSDGTQDLPISVEWDWSGRIFEAFDHEVVIPCRLELSIKDGGLLIEFIPRRLAEVLRLNQEALVDRIKSSVPANVNVYEGTYS